MPPLWGTTAAVFVFGAVVSAIPSRVDAACVAWCTFGAGLEVAEIQTAVLALEDGRPVGCGCFKLHAPEAIELKRMYVIPEARGRRIAAQIVHRGGRGWL